jgi:hypothetical protein
MVLITDEKRLCPVCGQAQADTDLETRTHEQELFCRNKDCGFFASTEIHTDSEGRQFWVETTMFPMTADGKVRRGRMDNRNKSGYRRSVANSPTTNVYALQTHDPLETRLEARGEPPILYGSRAAAEIAATDYNNKFHDEEPATVVEIEVRESFQPEVQQELAGDSGTASPRHKPPEHTKDPYSEQTLQRAYQMREEGSTRLAIMDETGLDRETADWIFDRHSAGLGPPAAKPVTIVETEREDEL